MELAALTSTEVSMKDTALGVAANQMARAVTANLQNLDPETKAQLKAALDDSDSDHRTGAI